MASSAIAEASGFDRRGDGQIGLARWIDSEKAILAFAVAGRLDALDAAKGHMKQAALAAVHGREGVWDAGAKHLLGGSLGRQAQFLGAQSLEVIGVKADEAALPLVEPQDLSSDCLQRQQQFAIVLRDQRHVRSSQLDAKGGSQLLGVGRSVWRGDAVLEAKSTELVEGGEESGNLLGSLLQVVNGHNKTVSQSRAVNGRGIGKKLSMPP